METVSNELLAVTLSSYHTAAFDCSYLLKESMFNSREKIMLRKSYSMKLSRLPFEHLLEYACLYPNYFDVVQLFFH